MADRNSIPRTLAVAALTALVCSLLVTFVSIELKPVQERNETENRQKNVLQVVGRLRDDLPVSEQFEDIDIRLVDLSSGDYVEDGDPQSFDARKAAASKELGVSIPEERDIAGLKRRARQAKVYLVRGDGEQLDAIILPVYGAGLWSTMYGFIAIEPDGNTIKGLTFYEQAETPGLGDKVADPRWLSQWQGKVIYDSQGMPQVEVLRGQVPDDVSSSSPPQAGDPVFQVDGMAGATLTGRGVTQLLRYWLGPDGFGPYLKRHFAEVS